MQAGRFACVVLNSALRRFFVALCMPSPTHFSLKKHNEPVRLLLRGFSS